MSSAKSDWAQALMREAKGSIYRISLLLDFEMDSPLYAQWQKTYTELMALETMLDDERLPLLSRKQL